VGWIDEVFSVESVAKLDSADEATERRRRGAPSRKIRKNQNLIV